MIGFGSNQGSQDVYTDSDTLGKIAGAGTLKRDYEKVSVHIRVENCYGWIWVNYMHR